MKKLDKKAFTLIELLVVVAIVGILVLLATPRFIGHTQNAEIRRIQHDVKVMEQKIGAELINNGDEFNSWEDNSKDFNQLIEDNKLFEKEGVAEEIEPTDGPYKVIPEKYKDKIKTKLKGTFYANSDGKVYYEHEKPLVGIPTIPGKPEKEPGYSDEEIQDLVKNHNFIPVATAEELDSIRINEERTYGKGTQWEGEYIGGLDEKYVQVKDIDLSIYSGEGWNPIGTSSSSFTGTYDGGNYVITDLEVKGEGKDYQGLFGYTEEATIRNVGLIDNTVTGANYVGGLMGMANSSTTISNSYSTGSVIGTGNYTGGLLGFALSSKINDSYATGSITGVRYTGGLLGSAISSPISNSYFTGEAKGIGGGYTGGLTGFANDSTISNSYATGSVEDAGDNTGGFVGQYVLGEISNSYATGSVSSSGNLVGGFVGMAYNSVNISNSHATGSVTGANKVGGFVGSANEVTISNSYAIGSVTGDSYTGGFVGIASSSPISNSYWDTNTTGQLSSDGGLGKTTDEMKKKDTYSGWDFDDVWSIKEGESYPYLKHTAPK